MVFSYSMQKNKLWSTYALNSWNNFSSKLSYPVTGPAYYHTYTLVAAECLILWKRGYVQAYTKETLLRPNKRTNHNGFQHSKLIISLVFEGVHCIVYGYGILQKNKDANNVKMNNIKPSKAKE